MNLALVQVAPGDDLEENAGRAALRIEEAATRGANVICFPEVHLSPFFPQFPGGDATQYQVALSHPAVSLLRKKCRELHVAAFPNVYLALDGVRYDASIAIGPRGDILGVSKMVHVVQVPRFHEQDYYAPSDSGFKVYHTPFGRVGIVICFDRHYPESFRSCALQGAEVILVPTVNTTDEPLALFEWEMRIAAVQNGLFVAMCNRVGHEHAMAFGGTSVVVGPDGGVIARADDSESILYAELDLQEMVQERERRPYLALRRPDLYRL